MDFMRFNWILMDQDRRGMDVEVGHMEIEVTDKIPDAIIIIVFNPAYPKRSGRTILNVVSVRAFIQQAFKSIKWLEIPKIRARHTA